MQLKTYSQTTENQLQINNKQSFSIDRRSYILHSSLAPGPGGRAGDRLGRGSRGVRGGTGRCGDGLEIIGIPTATLICYVFVMSLITFLFLNKKYNKYK